MQNRTARYLWLCAPAAAVLLLAAVRAVPTSAEEGETAASRRGPQVAVVKMDHLLRNSQLWRDWVEERSRLVDRMDSTLDRLKRRVQVLRNEYDNLPPGTDERSQTAAELELALRGLQEKRMELEDQVARRHDEAVRRLISQLQEVVREHADQNGIDIVLKQQDLRTHEQASVGQSLQIAYTEVLYADEGLDITPAVLKELNARYGGPIQEK